MGATYHCLVAHIRGCLTPFKTSSLAITSCAKKELNLYLGSKIVEEKSYKDYQ